MGSNPTPSATNPHHNASDRLKMLRERRALPARLPTAEQFKEVYGVLSPEGKQIVCDELRRVLDERTPRD